MGPLAVLYFILCRFQFHVYVIAVDNRDRRF